MKFTWLFASTVIAYGRLVVSGFCYQFNGNGTYRATAAGAMGGVRLLLDTAGYQYTIGPNSFSEGFTV